MKNSVRFFCFLIFILLPIVTVSCTTRPHGVGYSKYIPNKGSVFQITFEYPGNWEWAVYDDDIRTGLGLISTSNPDVVIEIEKTFSGKSDSMDPDLWKGMADVSVSSYRSSDEAKAEMNVSIANLLETKMVMRDDVLSDRIFKIGGYFARQITTKSAPAIVLGQDEPLIAEDIYIWVENKYYQIGLIIVESERYGDFGKGFDHMVKSATFLHP